MAITGYDIAKELNTTQATVSRALRDDPSISVAMRERVQKTAKRLNYRPNLLARGLVQGKTNTVGLLTAGMSLEISSAKMIFLDDRLHRAGYRLYVSNTKAEARRTVAAAEELVSRGVDGLIVYGLKEQTVAEQCQSLAALPAPVVFMDFKLPFPCLQVVQDRGAGVRQAVEHLISLGHRQIYNLYSSFEDPASEPRIAGYIEACRLAGLDVPPERLVDVGPPDLSPQNGCFTMDPRQVRSAVANLISCHGDCTAILCSNDLIAMSTVSALAEMGLRVPLDVSVVGFDNISATVHCHPQISTVAQPIREVVEAACDLLLAAISDGSNGERIVSVPSRFIDRQTTGPVRKAAAGQPELT